MSAETKALPTLADAFRRDAAYWGERGAWLIAYAMHRESDALARSNFRSMLRLLGGEGESVTIERASHWAVGWVDYLVIAPAAAELIAKAEEAKAGLEGYPILDENDFSEEEDRERQECWDSFARREWFRWFAEQCETEADAEWFESEHGEALATFLFRAYEMTCMNCGEAGAGPSCDYRLEHAARDSECRWWRDDSGMMALFAALELQMVEAVR